MKILIFGAGVVGSYFGYYLKTGGQDVTVLARGERAENLREDGLILEDALTGERHQTAVDVLESLEPGDRYDLIITAVRKNQLQKILPLLAENVSPRLLFLINNAEGFDRILKQIPPERAAFSFSATGGRRQEGVVQCLIREKNAVPLGSAADSAEGKQLVREIRSCFRSIGWQVSTFRNMDAWQKCHVALVSPAADALLTAGDNYRLAEDRELLLRAVRAIREGLNALKSLGLPVVPLKLKVMRLLPAAMLAKSFRKLLNTPFAEVAMTWHARSAPEEMKALSEEMLSLIEQAGTGGETFRELHKEAFGTREG